MRELPALWEWKRVQDISDKSSRYPVGDGDHGQIKPSSYIEHGIPYIRVNDIRDGTITSAELVYISEDTHRRNPKSHLKPNDIVIAKTGATIGRAAIIPPEMKTANTTSSVGKITVDQRKILPTFLLYYLNTQEFKDQMWKVSHKSAQPGFNIVDLKNFVVPIPPLRVQEHIVNVLQGAEEVKRIREQANQLTSKIIQSVFLKMFGNPATNSKKWKIADVESVCSSIIDTPHTTPSYADSGTPLVRTPNIKKGYIDLSETRYVTLEEHQKRSNRIHPLPGDILYAREATFGNAALVRGGEEFSVGQRIMLLRPNPALVNNEFLVSVMNSDYVYAQAANVARGATNPHVNVADVKNFKIILPPKHLQQRFSEIVAVFERLRKKQGETSEEIGSLFQSLMHKAFRGELKVN